MDPKLGVLGDRVATAATTGSLIGRLFGGGQAQRMSPVDLSLVKSEPEQSSRCVALRRRQIRRRGHGSEFEDDDVEHSREFTNGKRIAVIRSVKFVASEIRNMIAKRVVKVLIWCESCK